MTRGWFCTCSTEPSASTEPSCSTVTRAPRLRTKAMSCSTTMIVRSRARSRISAAVSSVSLAVVDQQHADLEPLLLAVAQRAGRLLTLLGQPDALQRRRDALASLLCQAGKQRPPGAAA